MEHKRVEPPPVYRMKPETKRQIWLQIWLPFILGVLVLMGIVTGLVLTRAGTTSAWADAALVFLLLPILLVGMIVIVGIGILVYFVGKLARRVPGPLRMADDKMQQVEGIVRRVSGQMVKPFIHLPASWASVQAAVENILSIFRAE